MPTRKRRIKAKAAAILTLPVERASYPQVLKSAGRAMTQDFATSLFVIDQAIERVNIELHRLQPPKDGKISVRFYKRKRDSVSEGSEIDRAPVAIKWFQIKRQRLGRAGALRYVTRPVYWARAPLADQRARGFDFEVNDAKTARMLTELQRLLEARAKISKQFKAARKQARRNVLSSDRRAVDAMKVAEKVRPVVDFLEHDDARHWKVIQKARAAEDRLRRKPVKRAA